MKLPEIRVLLLSLLCALVLVACGNVRLEQANVSGKAFQLERYFTGNTKAFGILTDRNGAPQRHFTADLRGKWDAELQTLTLDEDFIFDDGEKQFRQWVIKRVAEGRYTGKAADVIGEATGQTRGNAFRWQYVLQVPYQGRTINLKLDDWLFQTEDSGVVVNKATMSKFGFKVGEILISFKK